MTGKSLTITYFIPVTSFSVSKSQIDDLLKYLKTEENRLEKFEVRAQRNGA